MNRIFMCALCSLAVVFSAGRASAGDFEEVRFADAGIIVVDTTATIMVTSLPDIIAHGDIHTRSGDMVIVLSSREVITFEEGMLTGYFCGEDDIPEKYSDSRCRARVTNSGAIAAGGRIDDNPLKYYRLRIHRLDPDKKAEAKAGKRSPYILQSIDGVPLEITYKNHAGQDAGYYRIAKRR